PLAGIDLRTGTRCRGVADRRSGADPWPRPACASRRPRDTGDALDRPAGGRFVLLAGLLAGISGGKTFFALPPSMTYLGSTTWLGLPASIWICLIAFAIEIAVLGFTRPGGALYAIGGNVDAARAAGIRTDRVMWLTLIIGSALAALAGLLISGRLGSIPAAQ